MDDYTKALNYLKQKITNYQNELVNYQTAKKHIYETILNKTNQIATLTDQISTAEALLDQVLMANTEISKTKHAFVGKLLIKTLISIAVSLIILLLSSISPVIPFNTGAIISLITFIITSTTLIIREKTRTNSFIKELEDLRDNNSIFEITDNIESLKDRRESIEEKIKADKIKLKHYAGKIAYYHDAIKETQSYIADVEQAKTNAIEQLITNQGEPILNEMFSNDKTIASIDAPKLGRKKKFNRKGK